MNIVIVAAIVLLLLLVNEWLWRGRVHGEASRKFIHISVGSFVALWPLWLTWSQIEFLSLAFVAAVVVSRQFNVFKTIHSVQRPTWGELYFGAAVGLVAIVTREPAIYAVALLHMSLADGFAAVVGERLGRRSGYRIFGAKKSQVGTMTFLIISLAILVGFSLQQNVNLGLWLPLIAGGTTVLENLAIRGLDNLLIPLFVALVLGAVV